MTFPAGPDLPIEELHKEYFLNTFPFLLKCFEDYGDVFTLTLGDFGVSEFGANGHWVFLTKSEDIERLFKADNSIVYGGEANQIQFQKLVPPLSSTACDADEHLSKRRLLLKYFKSVEKNTAVIQRVTREIADGFPEGEAFSLFTFLKQVTYSTIFVTTMGVRGDDETRKSCSELTDLDQASTTMEEKRALISHVQDFLIGKINNERADSSTALADNDTVYEYLLHLKQDSDYVLSTEAMAQEVVSLLMGGIATTAIMLSWAFTFVLSDSAVEAKIREELKDKLHGAMVDEDNVESLVYLNSVILETLRIQPFMATPGIRLLKEEFEIGGYLLPEGTLVANCSYLLQRRPEYYQDPESFCPERFKDGEVSAYQWTPFGGGVRRCVGYAFAQHSMKVVMATIMQSHVMELAMPVDGAEFLGAFFGPKGGPLVVAKRIEE